jgi:hypothetical protein
VSGVSGEKKKRDSLPRLALVPDLSDKTVEILRLLGRMEYALTPYIAGLLYEPAGLSRYTMYRHLEVLYELGYAWRTRVNLAPRTRNTTIPGEQMIAAERKEMTPLSIPYVWGLTPEGKAYLELQEIEPDGKSLEGLKVRDRRAPKVPKQTLSHDLQAAWWSCGVIQEAMRCPFLHDVFVQVEYISLLQSQRSDGGSGQRIDALVGLRFDPDRDPITGCHSPGHIPWYDGFASSPRMWWEWFALEVDRGTEALKVLLGKGTVYRDLTLSNTYRRLLGGDLLPVFLVPTARRAGQIAREWNAAWVDKRGDPLPSAKGVIATINRSEHPDYGPLWGEYSLLRDGRKKVHLLKNWDLVQWNQLCEEAG